MPVKFEEVLRPNRRSDTTWLHHQSTYLRRSCVVPGLAAACNFFRDAMTSAYLRRGAQKRADLLKQPGRPV